MEFNELIKLAWNALKANKLRSLLTTLGIIIGVFAVIILVSLGAGLQAYITNQISGLGSNLIFVIPGTVGGARTPGGQQTNKLLLSDATTLSVHLKDIAQVGPVIQKTATVKYVSKSNKLTSILGTTANYPIIVTTSIDSGTFFSESQVRGGSKVAIIGQTLVTNLFPFSSPLHKKISIAGTNYTIIGVMKKRGSIFGIDQDNIAIIPITSAKRQFGVTNVNTIYLSAKNPSLVSFVKKKAHEALLKRLTTEDFTLQTQEETLSTIQNITNVLTIALGAVAAISLMVGGIGVMNIMLVSVTERTREIGLRKALGAQRRDILSQFLLEAVILSLTGGVIGIILGYGASLLLMSVFVSVVTPWSILLAFSFSVMIGIIFGMAPAVKASKLSPIEALRYE